MNTKLNSYLIDRDSLPEMWPTHCHSKEFWEHLGRAVATFACLEEILKMAIFALTATATRPYDGDEELKDAYEKWLEKLEISLTAQLWNLAELYEKAARDHSDATIENTGELVNLIKEATKVRNALCHGSWRPPDENGKSLPFFINKKMEVFCSPIDTAYLRQVQSHVAELACAVIDSVTCMGLQFPGSAGPGKPILT